MLDFFIKQIHDKVDCDFIQSLVNCFLKTHYDIIMGDDDLIGRARTIMEETQRSHEEVEQLINYNLCIISHFTGIQMQ